MSSATDYKGKSNPNINSKNTLPVLLIKSGSEKGKMRHVDKKRFVIGRKVGDLILSDAKISSAHVALESQELGYMLIDLDSTNGTFLNDKRISMSVLSNGDEIKIGDTKILFNFDSPPRVRYSEYDELEIESEDDSVITGVREKSKDPVVISEEVEVSKEDQKGPNYLLKVVDETGKGQTFLLSGERVVIGRVSADINLEDKGVSRKHAMIEISGGEAMLRDLSSKSGTFVNDRRILNCKLRGGEKIKIGKTILEFIVQ